MPGVEPTSAEAHPKNGSAEHVAEEASNRGKLPPQPTLRRSLSAEETERIRKNRETALLKKQQKTASQKDSQNSQNASVEQGDDAASANGPVYENHLTTKFKCEKCKEFKFIDEKLYHDFAATVCKECKADHPGEYATIVKTHARGYYLLSEAALNTFVSSGEPLVAQRVPLKLIDTDLVFVYVRRLPHISRPNTNNPTWAPVKLYLRKQVAEWSHAAYGGPVGLQLERKSREDKNESRRQERNRQRKRNRPQEDDSRYLAVAISPFV